MSREYAFEEDVPINGLAMPEDAFEELVDLVGSPYRYEMIDGVVYNMAPPSPEHDQIASNIRQCLEQQLGLSGPCRAFREQRVAIPGRPSVQPDVLVTCNLADWNKQERAKKHHRFRSPLIVVEILSPSTEAFDRAEKFARYQLCPTLEVYILVSQDEQNVEVHRRSTNWKTELFRNSETIQLDQLDLELPLDEIYKGVFY